MPLRRYLTGHLVETAHEQGWSDLSNGDLLDAAERNEYQILITTDQNLKHQQNLADRLIAIIVLLSNSWPRIQQKVDNIQTAVDAITRGEYKEFQFEFLRFQPVLKNKRRVRMSNYVRVKIASKLLGLKKCTQPCIDFNQGKELI